MGEKLNVYGLPNVEVDDNEYGILDNLRDAVSDMPDYFRGAEDVARTFASSIAAEVPSGLYGLTGFITPEYARGGRTRMEEARRRIDTAQNAMTIMPESEQGQKNLQGIADAVEPVGNWLAKEVRGRYEAKANPLVGAAAAGAVYSLMAALTETVTPPAARGAKKASQAVASMEDLQRMSIDDLVDTAKAAAKYDPNVANALIALENDMPLPEKIQDIYPDGEPLTGANTDAEIAAQMDMPVGSGGFGGRQRGAIGAKAKAKELSREQFQNSFDMHTDMRGRGAGNAADNAKSIMESGFKRGAFNRAPVSMADPNLKGMAGQYRPKTGDYVYLIPKDVSGKSASGRPSVPVGWKPGGEDGGMLVQLQEGEDLYEAYKRTANESSPANAMTQAELTVPKGFSQDTKNTFEYIRQNKDLSTADPVALMRDLEDRMYDLEENIGTKAAKKEAEWLRENLYRDLEDISQRELTEYQDGVNAMADRKPRPLGAIMRGQGGSIGGRQPVGSTDTRYSKRGSKLEEQKLAQTTRDVESREIQGARNITLSDLEGKPVVFSMSDRSDAGNKLVGINGVKFKDSVNLTGGQDFKRDNTERGLNWASGSSQVSNMMNVANRLYQQTGESPLHLPYRMSPKSSDFSTMPVQAMFEGLRTIPKRRWGAANDMIRKYIPGFKSIQSKGARDEILKLDANGRAALMDEMDLKFRDDIGFGVGEARLAITDPKQIDAPDAGLQNVSRFDMNRPTERVNNPSYPVATPGEYVGTLDTNANVWDMLPEQRGAEGRVVDARGEKLDPTDMYTLRMQGALGTVITEDLLRQLQAKGVKIASMAPAGIIAAALAAGLINEQDAEKARGELRG